MVDADKLMVLLQRSLGAEAVLSDGLSHFGRVHLARDAQHSKQIFSSLPGPSFVPGAVVFWSQL